MVANLGVPVSGLGATPRRAVLASSTRLAPEGVEAAISTSVDSPVPPGTTGASPGGISGSLTPLQVGGPALADIVKEALRAAWLSRHRAPEDFDLLWDLYWRGFGPLAAIPTSVHDLEEVLVR